MDKKLAARESLGRRMLQARFPHAATELELLETHISWVILTGAWAYKLKKPLRLDFLDYSTVDKRLQFCRREVEVNRVWAPDLYLGVVPIFEGDDRLRVGAVDEQPREQERVLDHAVLMRQFPQSALLSEQLKSGEISPDDMEQLATELAVLHRRSETVGEPPDLVQRAAVEPALENFRYLRESLAAGDPHRPAVERLDAWTRAALDGLVPLMQRRVRQGRLRNCHGDLHLENVLYLDGRFVLFDGIEFSDVLRQIDVLSELAFLAMELTEHGYAPHAHLLVNRYLEATEDYEGLSLLRYYLVYRAMVRAKVDLIRERQRADQQNREPGEGGSAAATFSAAGQQYIRYAERAASPEPARLWITYGPSGSGKSFAAERVIRSRGGLRLRSDVVRKRLGGCDPWTRPQAGQLASLYSPEMTQRTYERLLQWAGQVLTAGFSVIVDATFLKREQRTAFRALAERLGVEFAILLCDAPLDELRRRILARGADPSDATLEVLDAQLAAAEPPADEELLLVVRPHEIATA